MEPLTASAVGDAEIATRGDLAGALQPVVVDWLHVAVGKTVSVLSAFATKTFPPTRRAPWRRGPSRCGTEPVVTKFVGLLVVPSLSTLTVLLPLLAM